MSGAHKKQMGIRPKHKRQSLDMHTGIHAHAAAAAAAAKDKDDVCPLVISQCSNTCGTHTCSRWDVIASGTRREKFLGKCPLQAQSTKNISPPKTLASGYVYPYTMGSMEGPAEGPGAPSSSVINPCSAAAPCSAAPCSGTSSAGMTLTKRPLNRGRLSAFTLRCSYRIFLFECRCNFLNRRRSRQRARDAAAISVLVKWGVGEVGYLCCLMNVRV